MTQNTQEDFRIKFWGTRGSLATPDQHCSKAGGNTICVEVECGGKLIICDAGTGLRMLGGKIVTEEKHSDIQLLLSHVHYDHIEGIPFFAPIFSPDYKLDIWCGKLDGAKNTYEAVAGFMRRPYFPVGLEIIIAETNFHQLDAFQSFNISDRVKVNTMPLEHPGGATAYKIECDGKSFAYVTDTEHKIGETNTGIVDFIRGVDAFVYDASFSDDELEHFEGYGHSTWQEGLRMAEMANVKQYYAFHHMPFRSDEELDEIDRKIKEKLPLSGVARENTSFVL